MTSLSDVRMRKGHRACGAKAAENRLFLSNSFNRCKGADLLSLKLLKKKERPDC